MGPWVCRRCLVTEGWTSVDVKIVFDWIEVMAGQEVTSAHVQYVEDAETGQRWAGCYCGTADPQITMEEVMNTLRGTLQRCSETREDNLYAFLARELMASRALHVADQLYIILSKVLNVDGFELTEDPKAVDDGTFTLILDSMKCLCSAAADDDLSVTEAVELWRHRQVLERVVASLKMTIKRMNTLATFFLDGDAEDRPRERVQDPRIDRADIKAEMKLQARTRRNEIKAMIKQEQLLLAQAGPSQSSAVPCT
ncbi:hypothetical protein DIPPA_17371 [Diplonema papillatum]|nr:hypothetical protein DIPPA_17371 [Diplonema papillatum]